MIETVINRPEYTVKAETADFGRVFHISVHTVWSKRLKALVSFDLARLHLAFGPLHAAVFGANPKLRKFLGLIGFEYDQQRTNSKGEQFDFYRRMPPTKR